MTESQHDSHALSRRSFIRDASLIGATVLASAGARPAWGASPSGRKTVAVFGGGIAGLTAAHELAERGFRVTIYERRQFGGKSRSFGVPGTGTGGRSALPAEHSPYAILGSYRNFPATLQRIPVAGRANGALDNLVPAPKLLFARANDRDFTADLGSNQRGLPHADFLLKLTAHLPPHEAAYLLARLEVFFSSCDARRLTQWENMSWWSFLSADRFSEDYRQLAAQFITRHLVAQDPTVVSARSAGALAEGMLCVLANQAGALPLANVYAAPKDEALVVPWLAHLHQLGVTTHVGYELAGFQMTSGRVSSAEVIGRAGRHRVTADYFVCALPYERALKTFSPQIRAADSALDVAEHALATRWSSGVFFFLREQTPLTRGFVAFIDSPWAIVGYTQAQFWKGHEFADDFGDGTVSDCLSAAISDFDTPGILYGKSARTCTPEEIIDEVWAQMNAHWGDRGGPTLPESLIASTYIDPALAFGPSGIVSNEDPLVHNLAGYYLKRPTQRTRIPNLTVAGDWTRTAFPPPTSEAANESGKQACNAILQAAGSTAPPCEILQPYRLAEFETARKADELAFRLGVPNALDVVRI